MTRDEKYWRGVISVSCKTAPNVSRANGGRAMRGLRSWFCLAGFILTVVSLTDAVSPCDAASTAPLRGFFFNPWVNDEVRGDAWLKHYHLYHEAVDGELKELVAKTGINFLDIQILIPRTLARPKVGPTDDAASIDQWADMTFMKNVVRFLDVCHKEGVQVEIDLATNMWIPFSVDTKDHIANSRWWPVPDDTPWTESAVWYTQIIEYVEQHVRDKNVIAMWCMFGNYQLGGAEPVLWTSPSISRVNEYSELFVKQVWPRFRAAGERPKAAPIVLPILSNSPYWSNRSTTDRLRAMVNLKQWLVDDLHQAPDYWIVSTYVRSDPATDGVAYLQGLVNIVGRENAHRIISTDFKGPGHDLSQTIVNASALTGAEQIRWNLAKVREYGFGGWWMWSYRDSATQQTGIRDTKGNWRSDLVTAITSGPARRGAPQKGR